MQESRLDDRVEGSMRRQAAPDPTNDDAKRDAPGGHAAEPPAIKEKTKKPVPAPPRGPGSQIRRYAPTPRVKPAPTPPAPTPPAPSPPDSFDRRD